MINKIKSAIKKIFKKRPSLNDHVFFTALDYYTNIHIHSMEFKSSSKKKLIFFYVKTWNEVLCKTMKEWISNEHMLPQIPSRFLGMFETVHVAMRENGSPEIFIEKMNRKIQASIRIGNEQLTQIVNSDYYYSHHEYMVAILNFMTFYLQMILVASDKTIAGFNGELEEALKGTLFDEI